MFGDFLPGILPELINQALEVTFAIIDEKIVREELKSNYSKNNKSYKFFSPALKKSL